MYGAYLGSLNEARQVGSSFFHVNLKHNFRGHPRINLEDQAFNTDAKERRGSVLFVLFVPVPC